MRVHPIVVYVLIAALYQARAIIKFSKCKCGRSEEKRVSQRIIGGTVVPPHRYPWVAYIEVGGDMRGGGVIINDLYVLTAGHCLIRATPANLSIYLGVTDRKKLDGHRFRAKEFLYHQNFTVLVRNHANDIALVKLRKRLQFSKSILPVCLPNSWSDFSGVQAVVVGWGESDDSPFTDKLRETAVRVVSDENCKKSKVGRQLRPSMMCAYAFKHDACQGDSGGPLFYRSENGNYELIGLVSWGIWCASSSPGVYTRVTKFIPWIRKNTQDAYYCHAKRKTIKTH